MIAYGCVLPHSPLAYHNRSVQKALNQVAEDLRNFQVETVVSISGHPRYDRHGFSAYVAPQYRLSLRDLGDLATEPIMPVDHEAWIKIREQSLWSPAIIHPLDDAELDFSHVLPLRAILDAPATPESLSMLCINDCQVASPQERAAAGMILNNALQESPKRYAVLMSAEGAFTPPAAVDQEQAFSTVKEQNTALRYALSAFWQNQAPDVAINQKSPSCTAGTISLAKASFANAFRYEELAFEHAKPTSLFVSRLIPA